MAYVVEEVGAMMREGYRGKTFDRKFAVEKIISHYPALLHPPHPRSSSLPRVEKIDPTEIY